MSSNYTVNALDLLLPVMIEWGNGDNETYIKMRLPAAPRVGDEIRIENSSLRPEGTLVVERVVWDFDETINYALVHIVCGIKLSSS